MRYQLAVRKPTCGLGLTLPVSFQRFKTFMAFDSDGTQTAKTLGDLNVTEINLNANPTHITLPDSSMITGQSGP